MRSRRPPGPAGWSVAVLVLLSLPAGCAAGAGTERPPPAATTTGGTVSVPADGVLLRELGYAFGPRDTFSLPESSVLRTSVDQADNVTVVLSAPPAAAVAGYLRRALPAAGFRITADNPAQSTLTFRGQGWSGSFTGQQAASAVLLRPG